MSADSPTRRVGPADHETQVARLARLLGVEPADLPDLGPVEAADLRTLHDQVGRTIFAGSEQRFARIAGLSAVLPSAVAAKLAETFLPPVIAARVAEVLDPARASDLVRRLSVRYLADVAAALDPVRSAPVVRSLSPERIGAAARELFDRREHAVLAQLVVAVDLAGLFAALAAAAPRDLLAVVPLLEWTDDLDHVVANLPGEQVDAVVAELHPGELADLALALDPSRFGPIVGRIDDRTVVAIAVELVGRGEHQALARFAVVVTPAQLDAVLGEAAEHDVEAVLLHLPPELAATVLDRASARG